ncbi:hypothetical protein TL16_g12324 [Triparma laevis f. inornata]|uniref:Uncharacterized protein n=1 Tax=Triparma laevis f. inornata TaxID=1714386 RepID=A0A9W7BJI7_9STRA|nr:hypothetical protein TL16_g12324 [Triparma laevis f. inornata]
MWKSIRPEVCEYFQSNWVKWTKEQPSWFNRKFIMKIPDDFIPLEALDAIKRERKLLAAKKKKKRNKKQGGRRKKSNKVGIEEPSPFPSIMLEDASDEVIIESIDERSEDQENIDLEDTLSVSEKLEL